jgi:DNA repair protein RecO (recombination protein O)
MEDSKKTLAIVLNRQDYREYDSLVSFYTLEFGKLTLMARGTKRLKSKLAGHLEPISVVDLMIIPGKGRDYAAGAISQEVFSGIKADLNKLYYAGLGLRWFRRLTSENEPDKTLFFLVFEYLNILDKYHLDDVSDELPKDDGELLFSFFAFKFMFSTLT